MRAVFSPNGTHPFDMGDFRVKNTTLIHRSSPSSLTYAA
jgi:hypothetical protein